MTVGSLREAKSGEKRQRENKKCLLSTVSLYPQKRVITQVRGQNPKGQMHADGDTLHKSRAAGGIVQLHALP